MPPREALPRMRDAARQALAIDASLPEGHAMLGIVAAMFDYDWQDAERHFRLAFAGGGAALVHRYYAHYCLLPQGRGQEGVQHHDVAVKNDPLNLTARSERAACLYVAGRHSEGEAEMQRILELDASFWFPYFILSHMYALDGREEEALRLAEIAYRVAPWFLPIVGVLAALLIRAGNTERGEALALQLRSESAYRDPIGPAMYHLLCGNLDAAADWIEKAIDQRQPAVFFFLNITATDWRSSPRWPALARMINLPQATR